MSHPNDPIHQLIGNNNAQDWARAFIDMLTEQEGAGAQLPVDEGTMIGWFANAIMTGYDAGAEYERKRDLLDKIREIVFTAAGAATGPLLEDNPDYTFPSRRVKDAVDHALMEFGIPVDPPEPEPAPSTLARAIHDEQAPPDPKHSAYHNPPPAA
jgi:hypothetical protein